MDDCKCCLKKQFFLISIKLFKNLNFINFCGFYIFFDNKYLNKFNYYLIKINNKFYVINFL